MLRVVLKALNFFNEEIIWFKFECSNKVQQIEISSTISKVFTWSRDNFYNLFAFYLRNRFCNISSTVDAT